VSLEIPYTTETRPDTGVTTPKLGIWLFLASEVMLFASLFSAYALLRSGADAWPDQSAILSVTLGAINTGVLLASSMAIGLAWNAIRAQQVGRYRAWMGACILLGGMFLGVKAFEWADKLQAGLVPSMHNFLGLYFTMTGLHAAHLAVGLAINLYLWGPGLVLWRRDAARFSQRVEIARLYWNFVDVVWIVLFAVFYLL
jgi:heme/copper-type cytochrome/quinol oxidase subunit 3